MQVCNYDVWWKVTNNIFEGTSRVLRQNREGTPDLKIEEGFRKEVAFQLRLACRLGSRRAHVPGPGDSMTRAQR